MSDLRWLDRGVGSPVVGPRCRISGGLTAVSDLQWLDRGVGSPVVGPRCGISSGWTAMSDLRWLDHGIKYPVFGQRGGSFDYYYIYLTYYNIFNYKFTAVRGKLRHFSDSP